MAVWQNAKTYEIWSDGLNAAPGDDDFTVEPVASKWGADGFNYVGTPNWEAPIED